MWIDIVTICCMGFLAAAVDSIAGGGGLISLPALLLVGVPPHLALGTNKFAATTASFTSSLTFLRSGKVFTPLAKWQVPFTFVGAVLGVLAVLRIDGDILNRLVPFLILAVGSFTVFHKKMGLEDRFAGLNTRNIAVGALFASALGFYDGFFGPGTGSFLIFLLVTTYGFNFITASANGRVLNFTSNLASLLMFAIQGKILLVYGVPMAAAMIVGARLGTKLAITKGTHLIRPIFVTMSLLVAGKMIYAWF